MRINDPIIPEDSIDEHAKRLLLLEINRIKRRDRNPYISEDHWDLDSPYRNGHYEILTKSQMRWLLDNAEVLEILNSLSDPYFAAFYNMQTGLHKSIQESLGSGFRWFYGIGYTGPVKAWWRGIDRRRPYMNALPKDRRSAVNPEVFDKPVIEVCQDLDTTLEDMHALQEIALFGEREVYPHQLFGYIPRAVRVAVRCTLAERFDVIIGDKPVDAIIEYYQECLAKPHYPPEVKRMIAGAIAVHENHLTPA